MTGPSLLVHPGGRPLRGFAVRLGKINELFLLCVLAMLASLLLGGGTRAGFVSDAFLQLLAIPLLSFALWRAFEVPWPKQTRRVLWFCLALAALPFIQLIPLPPEVWRALTNRQPSAETFEILGHAVPWMPISVSPQTTWLSALSLVPPIAIFLSTVLLGYRHRRLLSLIVLAVGVISVSVGLVQVSQGPDSSLRFFKITNPTEAVGFFANRNHFAALLYCMIVFCLAWTAHASMAIAGGDRRKEYDFVWIVSAVAGVTLLIAFLAGQAMARSRAGLALTIVALFCAIAFGFSDRRAGWRVTTNKLLLSAVALSVIFALQFAFYRILDRFTFDPLEKARHAIVLTTIEAAKAYFPWGSGLGTFVSVYPMFERAEAVSDAYVNRAHNDILEVSLETGLAGIALMGLFLLWLVWRSVQIWRNAPPHRASELDWSLARAATLVVALLIVHSLVDYPLRTGAMAAIMAFACALLIEPPAGVYSRVEFQSQNVLRRTQSRDEPTEKAAFDRARTKLGALGSSDAPPLASRETATEAIPPRRRYRDSQPSVAASSRGGAKLMALRPSDAPPLTPSQRWGADIQWPKEWTKEGASQTPSSKKDPQGSS
jgi:O-antigen ligase